MSSHAAIDAAAHGPWYLAWGVPLAAPILSFAGVAWGIVASGNRQIAAEDRRAAIDRRAAATLLAERQAVARALIYAQLRRALLTAIGHSAFIDDPENGVVYVAIYRSLLPTIEALQRVELLSVAEVRAVTSFFYSYQEEIGFLTGSAEEYVARRKDTEPPIHLELDHDTLAYPLATDAFRAWARQRLGVVQAKADKAIDAIRAYCAGDQRGANDQLLNIIAADDRKRAGPQAGTRAGIRGPHSLQC